MACGCTVVVKPSEFTPLTALAAADLALQAGIPAVIVLSSLSFPFNLSISSKVTNYEVETKEISELSCKVWNYLPNGKKTSHQLTKLDAINYSYSPTNLEGREPYFAIC